MRILHIPEISVPLAESAPAHPIAIVSASVPALDPERVESLEHIAKTLLQRIAEIEERLSALEAQRAEKPSATARAREPMVPEPATPEPAAPAPVIIPPLTIDTEAMKKGLLTKMWKYMNDEKPSRAV